MWAATCGNVSGVELLLRINDRGIPADEIEKEEEVGSDKDDMGIPRTEQGEDQLDANDGGKEKVGEGEERETQQSKSDEDIPTTDKGDQLNANDGGTENVGEENDKETQEGISGRSNSADQLREEEKEKRNKSTPCDERDEEREEEHKTGQDKSQQESVLQPLHAAASVGSEEVCVVLMDAGAKVARK